VRAGHDGGHQPAGSRHVQLHSRRGQRAHRPEALLAAADEAGRRLGETAFQARDSAQWVGISLAEGVTWTLGAAPANLYDGLTGIALFLGWLAELTGDPHHAGLARRALRTARDLLARPGHRRQHGLVGLAGISYALVQLGTLWSDDDLITAAVDCARELGDGAGRDAHDFVGGSVGDIAALATLAAAAPSAGLDDQIRSLADALLSAAVPVGEGIGWVRSGPGVPEEFKQPVSGFAHGAAGIAVALCLAWRATGDDRYRQAPRQATAFEQASFNPGTGRWRELRGRQERTGSEMSRTGDSGAAAVWASRWGDCGACPASTRSRSRWPGRRSTARWPWP
jgi:lantibiotic modifying enzyme